MVKRSKNAYGCSTRKRLPLEEDFETVIFRTASRTGPNGHPKELASSYVRSAWTVGTSWAPEDNYEFALDADEEWFDEVLVGDVMDEIAAVPKQKKLRSSASVS